MSKLSIYETNWINLVFENKNQEYGAYQLRQHNGKTSLLALFMGLLLCASLLLIPKALGIFSIAHTSITEAPIVMEQIIQITHVVPPQIKKVQEQLPVKAIIQKPVETIKKTQLNNPTIVKAPLATPDVALTMESQSTATTATDPSSIIGSNPLPAVENGTGNTKPTDYGNTILGASSLDKLPEFPGGINKFYNYVGKNFESPEINAAGNIRIFVSFVVEKDGSMSDIQVKNNPGYELSKEAIRVLKSLKTRWSPGMIGSKPVRTAYNLPIIVKMN
jgi:protein TonB